MASIHAFAFPGDLHCVGMFRFFSFFFMCDDILLAGNWLSRVGGSLPGKSYTKLLKFLFYDKILVKFATTYPRIYHDDPKTPPVYRRRCARITS